LSGFEWRGLILPVCVSFAGLDSKPYHCGYCSYRSCLKGETRRHVTRQHGGKAVNIVFRESEVVGKEQIDDMIEACFNAETAPTQAPATPAAAAATAEESGDPDTAPKVLSCKPVEGSEMALKIKLGPAYREWYCCYCVFSATSKYHVKQHCIVEHPGRLVDVSDVHFRQRTLEKS
jgi:hypothetical protein